MTCNKDANEELKQLMDAINAAWFEQQYDQFVRLFHQDIVFNSPDFSRQIKGREACVQSYRDFMRLATIDFFQTQSPQIDLAETTAVVKVPFEMHYNINEKNFREKGMDIFVCTVSQDRWVAVWRYMVQTESW